MEQYFTSTTVNLQAAQPGAPAESPAEAVPMRVVIMSKSGAIWSIWLPSSVEGHYKFQDDNGLDAELPFYIEGVNGSWVAFSGRTAMFRQEGAGGNDILLGHEIALSDKMLVYLYYRDEKYVFYAEAERPGDSIFLPYYLEERTDYTIGRREDNDICYSNITVSRSHAKLHWEDGSWHIIDQRSTHGIYVNGHKVDSSRKLRNGDSVFIMGLYLLMGAGFVAINNANDRIRINTPKIRRILSEKDVEYPSCPAVRQTALFDRQPRKLIRVAPEPIVIDMPPMPMSAGKIPLLLRLASPAVMGGRALATGNVLSALTSLVFPAVTQGVSEKDRRDYESRRLDRYRAYLQDKETEIEAERQNESRLLNENYPTVQNALGFALTKQRLWERRKSDEDFLRVRIGTGQIPMIAEKQYNERKFELEPDPLTEEMYALAEKPTMLEDAPVLLALRDDHTIGVLGDTDVTLRFVRNMIFQIASTHSYDEVKLVLLAEKDRATKLDFVRYLPHNWDDDRATRFFASTQSEVQQLGAYLSRELEEIVSIDNPERQLKKLPAYVVLALDKQLFDGVEILKDIIQHEKYCGVSVVTAFDSAPKECSRIVDLRDGFRLINLTDPGDEDQPFSLDEYDADAARGAVRELMRTKLKIGSQLYTLPNMLTFLEMYGAGKVEHLNPLKRWSDNNPVKSLAAPVGVGTDGRLFSLDLHEKRQGPHGLVAGMTGSGKSEFIITYILSMAVNYSPDEVAFILIDYKGGGLADAFENKERGIHLPHLVGTITNLDGAAIQRSLMSINSELKRRQTVFKQAKTLVGEGTMDIYDYQKLYRAKRVTEPMPHLFIISDEFAELKSQQPEFMDELISAARIGRSLGVHLILATQKPGGVVNNQIWSNTKFRVCLRVQDRGDSMEMLKRPEAAELKNTGRFYLQVGYNEYFALGQSAWCGAGYSPRDELVSEADNSIQFIDNVGQTVLNAKPAVEEKPPESKQIVAIVQYLSDLAKRENIEPRSLWAEPLPAKLELQTLMETAERPEAEGIAALIGMIDDPERQSQYPLFLDLQKAHNILVAGNGGSGKSTFLRTMLYTLVNAYSPQELNYYILDLSNGALGGYAPTPHCGAYLTENNEADFNRLLELVKELVAERKQLFAEAEVTGFDAYRQVARLPLVLVILDGYINITMFKRGTEIANSIHEYMRDGANFGIRFVLTCNHMNEVGARAKQELDYRIALRAKDRYEYGDMLDVRCKSTPPEINGRGLCVCDGAPLEYHVAMLDCFEDDQTRASLLRKRLDGLSARYAGENCEKRLPMIDDEQTYEAFAKEFVPGRIPLGYSRRDMKRVALPLRQLQAMALYFGNRAGVKPVLRNLLAAAAGNGMHVIILRSDADSVFLEGETLPGSVKLLDCTVENLERLDKSILDEIALRNQLRDAYCEKNGIPGTDKNRTKKAAGYIRANSTPVLLLIESFNDFCRLEKSEELLGEFAVFFSRTKNYNLYYAGCFYPEDDDNLGSNELAKALCQSELLLLFGGRYDRQKLAANLPMEYRKMDKPFRRYDQYLMKYRGDYYAMQMPCGVLTEETGDPDDASIV